MKVKLLWSLCVILMPVAQCLACVKTVRWYDDAPYSFRTPTDEIRGFDADLARTLLARMGCTVKFVQMPWARALTELEAGRLDILPGTLRNEERARFAYFSMPALESPNVLYLSRSATSKYHIARLEDLLGTPFRLGVQRGVSYGSRFDLVRQDPRFIANLVPITLRRSGWRMLELGRIDGLIADQASARLELKQLSLETQIADSGIVVSSSTAVFAFSKRSLNPLFVAEFDKQLAIALNNGSYRTIRQQYLGCPPREKILGCK